MSIFGSLRTNVDVELAVTATLQKWLPTYLAEVERQHDLDVPTLPRPKSWTIKSRFERWPEEQLPTVVVIAAGLGGKPVREGGGQFRAPFAAGVAAIVSGRDQGSARTAAGLYAAAIRAVLLQHQRLDGAAFAVDWMDERYDDLDADETRSLASCRAVFTVDVPDVVTAAVGPTVPQEDSTEPFPPWPIAEEVAADLEPMEDQ